MRSVRGRRKRELPRCREQTRCREQARYWPKAAAALAAWLTKNAARPLSPSIAAENAACEETVVEPLSSAATALAMRSCMARAMALALLGAPGPATKAASSSR